MRRKRIDRLIDASGLQGFDFANQDCEVNWTVALRDQWMLARRTVTTDEDTWHQCFAVPYALLEETENLYEDIVIDFVATCANDMEAGGLADAGIFRDYAGPNDLDFAELLSFFNGRDYADFLSDAFHWFAAFKEAQALIGDEELDDVSEPSIFTEDERLAQKVIWHLADMEATIETEDGVFYWEFAFARGEIWFHRVEVEFDDDYGFVSLNPSFGHIIPGDSDAFGTLRDAVIADFIDESAQAFEADGEVFELLNFDLEDIIAE